MSHRTVTIRLLDEVNCVVLGLHERDREDLCNEYAVFKEGAQFSPQFKLGRWDGKIRFFQKNCKTFINLLDEIVPKLKRMGYAIKIDDRRTAVAVFPDPIDNTYLQEHISPKTGKPIILERHQVDMANALFDAGSGIAIAGTGAGKTYTCAVLADVYGKLGLRCIVIVPDKTLVRQTRKSFIDCGVDTGIYYGEEKDLAHMHVISTWQSLQNATALLSDYQVVIVDECVFPETLITTPDGEKPICQIVPGDMVLTLNEDESVFEFKPVVKVFKNMLRSLREKRLRLTLDNGSVINITGNHPVLTQDGWKRADELSEEDELVTIQDTPELISGLR